MRPLNWVRLFAGPFREAAEFEASMKQVQRLTGKQPAGSLIVRLSFDDSAFVHGIVRANTKLLWGPFYRNIVGRLG